MAYSARISPAHPSIQLLGSSSRSYNCSGVPGLGLDDEVARQEDEGETVGLQLSA
jgi:hypothetical protein